ncbi:hypothetical protein [Coleofasciculus sp. G2-EDA-02]|uniref:hypothetical protein n=1 Tax=Coleofasciculus sp. G2-EDA-02 TaxID=3069529 RepID=UPI00406420D6
MLRLYIAPPAPPHPHPSTPTISANASAYAGDEFNVERPSGFSFGFIGYPFRAADAEGKVYRYFF